MTIVYLLGIDPHYEMQAYKQGKLYKDQQRSDWVLEQYWNVLPVSRAGVNSQMDSKLQEQRHMVVIADDTTYLTFTSI